MDERELADAGVKDRAQAQWLIRHYGNGNSIDADGLDKAFQDGVIDINEKGEITFTDDLKVVMEAAREAAIENMKG